MEFFRKRLDNILKTLPKLVQEWL